MERAMTWTYSSFEIIFLLFNNIVLLILEVHADGARF